MEIVQDVTKTLTCHHDIGYNVMKLNGIIYVYVHIGITKLN